jgi:molybdopterin converting factor small subunit
MTEPATTEQPTDEELAAELEALRAQLVASGWSAPDRPQNVIQALARVMLELPGIGKTNESEQGYKYRGIEAITAHAQQLLGRHCVVFVPRVVERKTVEFSINNRPWTEDQATIIYTVYGPGGVQDSIEVGPLIALGRDNSDKGMNKCMTQAFKYALLQTLCIGDHKDDADGEEAHQADARETVTPERQARIDMSARIRALTPEGRDDIRAFCDEHDIPRVTAQMTDEQLEAVGEKVDALAIAAAQDAAAEAPQAPVSDGDADEPAADATLPLEQPEPQPEVVHAPEVIAHVRAVVKTQVELLEGDELKDACRELELSIMGSDDAKRARLVNARVANVLADPDDLATALAIEVPAPEVVAEPAPEA